MNDATLAQNKAARPEVSTWLTANAGSGKTRVLTNRVARLLLNGVRPESILCLTYTTAAANEMQNRLFKTLGAWAMLPDENLRSELSTLGEAPPDNLSRARTLFASAIEAPGGLKIQTIHSFCSKVLRQFPLEAGVNPQFRELDETMQSIVIADTIEEIAVADPDVLQDIQAIYSGQDIADLARDVAKNAEGFSPERTSSDIFNAYGLNTELTVTRIVTDALSSDDTSFLKSLVPVLLELGSSNDQKLAAQLSQLSDDPDLEDLMLLEQCLLTKGSAATPFSFSQRKPTNAVKNNAAFAPLLSRFVDIGQRVERARESRVAIDSAEQVVTLHKFAAEFLPRYAARKSAKGALDFDDLIRRTNQLLTTRSLSWVLYRLDGRIDHVLVDEAQDTSPAQWDIIEALASELIAGDSERSRTLFVVGDKKQSIYSFQGADATGFDKRGEAFGRQLEHGSGLAKGELLHSFRSSPAILDAVDAVFSKNDGTGAATQHQAIQTDMPGRVDLWPVLPQTAQDDDLLWYDTSDRAVENAASHQLAAQIADYIADLLKTGSIQGNNGEWRRVRAGDIMILVQRRSALFDKIIAACKSLEIAIAGADRLKIGSELAVRDILALLSFLALPEDDLSLASALRSPLFSWSEDDLFRLAAHRKPKTYLWQELRNRRADFPNTFDILTRLRDRVDFERPFELIHTILTQFGGRRQLLARLGPEAEDGVDELLSQALAFERSHIPTLTEFLSSVHASDIEVKRETETTGDVLRVMTVHGAKGLESPIVILPDTTARAPQSRQSIIKGPGGLPALTRSRDLSTAETQAAKDVLRAADDAERQRLLYVAMTRAEKWLIVAGIERGKSPKSSLSWHQSVRIGLENLGARTIETLHGPVLRHQVGTWLEGSKTPDLETDSPGVTSNWPQYGPAKVPSRPTIRSPSELGGNKVLSVEHEIPADGLKKGRQMHLLLEHLPMAKDPQSRAKELLSTGPDAAGAEDIDTLTAEALDVINDHEVLFGPNSFAEVEIVGEPKSLGARISGTIDRLYVSPTRVLAVDFKTNSAVPSRPEDTPEGILRQMGAYLEALEDIYSEREVSVAILWTRTGQLMPLEHGIVRSALQRATTS